MTQSTSSVPENNPKNRVARRRNRQLTSTQVVFAAILAIGLMLTINFSTRIQADRDLQTIRNTVLQEIDLLKREQAALIEELNYAGSDAYVEAWAHSAGKMVRDGEVLIIPVPSTQFLSAQDDTESIDNALSPIVANTTRPQPDEWELWWALFFDSAPPQF